MRYEIRKANTLHLFFTTLGITFCEIYAGISHRKVIINSNICGRFIYKVSSTGNYTVIPRYSTKVLRCLNIVNDIIIVGKTISIVYFIDCFCIQVKNFVNICTRINMTLNSNMSFIDKCYIYYIKCKLR